MSEQQLPKPEPVFFTLYFDKDFHPDEYFLQRKEEHNAAILEQKIREAGWDPNDYDEMLILAPVGGKAVFSTVVNCGNMWKEVVNVLRVARFPKGWEGEKALKLEPEATIQ